MQKKLKEEIKKESARTHTRMQKASCAVLLSGQFNDDEIELSSHSLQPSPSCFLVVSPNIPIFVPKFTVLFLNGRKPSFLCFLHVISSRSAEIA